MLMAACRSGLLSIVEHLFERGYSLNQRNEVFQCQDYFQLVSIYIFIRINNHYSVWRVNIGSWKLLTFSSSTKLTWT